MILREDIRNKIFENLLLKESKKPNFHKLLRGLTLSVGDSSSYNVGSITVSLSNIKDISNFKDKCECLYRKSDDAFDEDSADGKEEYYGDYVDFENTEIQTLTPSELIIYAGGDWQPMHSISVKMKDGELVIHSCERADDKKMGGKSMKQDDFTEKLLEAPF
jgi:hypothetical protein|tara:strand:- start:3545 stop:4030 length:486 start_codon:yes stop_codon:yes gene_type:complete